MNFLFTGFYTSSHLFTYCQSTDQGIFLFVLFLLTVFLTGRSNPQIDCHFHYLDIHAVESKRPTHFSIVTNDRTYSFSTTGDAGNFSSVRPAFICTKYIFLTFYLLQNADVILTDLVSAIKQIFPTVPLKYIIRKVHINQFIMIILN